MIWMISDIHGGQDMNGLKKYASSYKKDDLLIILGDLELFFRDTEDNKEFSEYFVSLPCNIAFIDGNHENFDYLNSLPQEDWNGGRVHRISPNIVHLMRGFIFNIEGKSFLTMGGCKSSQKWRDWGLCWEDEIPKESEIQRGYDNLSLCGNSVDYILTHKYLSDPLRSESDSLTLEGFIHYVDTKVSFRHWYSGHWHKSECMDDKHTVVFDDLIQL